MYIWRESRRSPELSNSQLAIRCQHCRYGEKCTYEGEEERSGLHNNDTEGTLGGAIALEKQNGKKNIAHDSNVGPFPPFLCGCLSCFQSPSRWSKDGSPADIELRTINPAYLHRVVRKG